MESYKIEDVASMIETRWKHQICGADRKLCP